MELPQMARLLGISEQLLVNPESDRLSPMASRLVEVKDLLSALTDIIRYPSLAEWLVTPNQAFDNLKPLEVIERGETDPIWAMVYFLRSGVPV